MLEADHRQASSMALQQIYPVDSSDLIALLQVQSHRDLVSTSGPSHSFRGDPQGAAADHSWEAALEAAQQAVAGLGQGDSTGSCMDPGHAAAALHSHMASVHSNAAGGC